MIGAENGETEESRRYLPDAVVLPESRAPVARRRAGGPKARSARCRRVAATALGGALLVPAVATTVLAHPLGNFTINHYAGIRVEPQRVLLDVVIDEAEIPTFQATSELDADGDGELSNEELRVAEVSSCASVGSALELTVDGTAAPLRLIRAGISFPAGNGGLSTMRLVCTIEAPLAPAPGSPVAIAFADRFEAARIGWREIAVAGSGVTIWGTDLPAVSATARLTSYPATLASAPDVRSASFIVTPGGPTLPPLDVPDADPVEPISITATGSPDASASPAASGPSAGSSTSPSPGTAGAPPASAGGGSVPGREGAIPEILRALPVTPGLALLAFMTAALLGGGHALTPGHGKTLMAAYLVGTRGTPRHALGLGAAVSISHTLGIVGLAGVVVAAELALPPDLVVRVAPVVAALTIVAIGGWMLLTEARRWRGGRRASGSQHEHEHEHAHAHGGVRHRDVPPSGATITWRSLFILGLAGGLIPSTNALLILLATIAGGQPAWGIVLVVAFGLGMAAVMAGAGLAFVYARGLLERGADRVGMARVARLVPAAAAVLVLAMGVVLTRQALVAARLG